MNGLIYAVDSSDFDRIGNRETAKKLHGIIQDEQMSGVQQAIIANKQNLPHAYRCNALIEKLKLNQ